MGNRVSENEVLSSQRISSAMKYVRINVTGITDEEPQLQCGASTIIIAIPDDIGLRDAITHVVHHAAAEIMRYAASEALIGLREWPRS
jgi:hypothetical protein